MSKNNKQDLLIAADAPLMRCIDCTHWRSRGEIEHADYLDIAVGRCGKSGLQCPPMHSCGSWEDELGNTKHHTAEGMPWGL